MTTEEYACINSYIITEIGLFLPLLLGAIEHVICRVGSSILALGVYLFTLKAMYFSNIYPFLVKQVVQNHVCKMFRKNTGMSFVDVLC